MIGSRPVADLPESQHDPAEVQGTAEDILSRPEYDEPGDSILDRANEAIGDLLERVFDGLGAPIGGGTAGALAWLVLVLLVGGVLAFVVWAVARGVFTGGRGGSENGDQTVVLTEESRTSSEWTAVAEEHEAAGRWREGLLCRYRALVVDLSDRGWLPDVAGRTAGEYVRDLTASLGATGRGGEDVRARRGAVDSFHQATNLFEEVWYGGAEAGSDERDRFAALAAATLAATETLRPMDAVDPVPAQVGAGSENGDS